MSKEFVNRREFAKRVAVASSAVPLAAGLGESTAAAAELPDDDTKPAKAEKPEAPKPKSQAELLAEVIRQRYPDERLDEKTLARIRGDVASDLRRSRALSAFPLSNSDEPAFVFAAYRQDDGVTR